MKPAVKGNEYLLFLRYQEQTRVYYAVCDYQGIYEIPSDEIKAKGKIDTLDELDMDRYYDGEPLYFLLEIYNEVLEKYIK
ncbi:MAG: hypothetical protein GX027_05660 [Clostridiaceae bacterium]|nr:hypothetical protein [Clostridiaceae bacterium]